MQEQMIKVFNNYVNNYDMNNPKIKLKYYHSFRVMELSEKIARNLFIFNEEEIQIIRLIGLYHDIGRFEQVRKYDTFNDLKSIDHGSLATEILFDKKLIRQIIINEKYDEIIKTAIYIHNKKEIPTFFDERLKEYCQIVRDADKIDILKLNAEDDSHIINIDSYPTKEVYEDFSKMKIIDRHNIKNNADCIIQDLCFLFDINYKYSFAIIKDNNYIDKYIDRQNYINEEIKDFFKQINKSMNEYIIKKI